MKKNTIGMLLVVVIIGVVIFFSRRNTPQTSRVQENTSSSQTLASSSAPSQTTSVSSQATGLKPSSDLTSQTYQVTRGDITLVGTLTADRNYAAGQRPLMILAHGFANTSDQYSDYADFYARMGFVVYRFDFYGGSRSSKSGGTDMLNMSVLTEESDLAAVVDQFSRETFIDSSNINLMGASQGGVVATLYAADNPGRINKLVLAFPAFVLFDDVKETYNNLGVASVDQIPVQITHRNARLGAIYLRDALGIDYKAKQAQVTSPVLVIHGTQVNVVPYRYAQEAVQTFPKAQLVTVEGGGHWMDSRFNALAQPAIQNFFQD